jgi:hypothetical protein
MTIIERTTQFGSYSVLFQLDDGNGMRLQFKDTITDEAALAQAQEIYDRQVAGQQYNTIETLEFNILDHTILLKEFITKIKENINVTLAQYNAWLGTKTWNEAAIIKYFVYTLAVKLSERKGITLTDYTEEQVLQKLRDWIVATNLKTIGKAIGYGTPND